MENNRKRKSWGKERKGERNGEGIDRREKLAEKERKAA